MMVIQKLSFADFSKCAVIVPLENHGRVAEVFHDGVSLGFVDSLGIEGLRQAHRACVNNALYFNSPDVPEFNAPDRCELPTLAVLNEYPDLIEIFPEAAGMVLSGGAVEQ